MQARSLTSWCEFKSKEALSIEAQRRNSIEIVDPAAALWRLDVAAAVAMDWATLVVGSVALEESEVESLAQRIASQLHADARALDCGAAPSDLSEHAPRIHGKVDKANRLAHRVAEAMWPPEDSEPLRVWAMIRYKQLVAKLSAHRRDAASRKEIARRLKTEATVAHLSRRVYDEMKLRPISEAVLSPRPMPITPAPGEQFEPFITFLKENKPVFEMQTEFERGIGYSDGRMDLCKQGVGAETQVEFERGIVYSDGRMDLCKQGVGAETQVEFERGIVYSDGRMDLCKQGVGAEFERGIVYPDGRMDLCKQGVGSTTIERVLEALVRNTHVVHFLLGNDIIGPQGGKAIAKHIRSPHSRIQTWYLAGNMLNAEAMSEIAHSLRTDTLVQALWLKRNPLLLAGADYLAQMLRVNSSLRILDLDNTGLLDEGVEALLRGLSENEALETLYLSANGVTARGARAVGAYFEDCGRAGRRGVVNLMMSVNRIGDEGAIAIAKGLSHNKTLQRLVLGSEQIESEGAKALCASLKDHPTLHRLDLGMYLSTADMGELPNRIEDAGAFAVASLLDGNQTLKSVSVSHNALTTAGVQAVTEAALTSHSLIDVEIAEKGLFTDKELQEKLRAHLKRNIEAVGIKEEHLRFVRNVPESAHIDSLYRTRDFKLPNKERRLIQKWWDGEATVAPHCQLSRRREIVV